MGDDVPVTSPDDAETQMSSETRDGATVLAVAGDVDMSNSDALRTRASEILRSGADALVLDLSGVTFFASSGIAALAQMREESAALGGRPVHVVASRSVRLSLRSTAMDRLLPLHSTVDEALEAVGVPAS